MALQKREKVLAGIMGALLVAIIGWQSLSVFAGYVGNLRRQRNQLAEEIAQCQEQIDAAKEAQERLDQWNRRALPSDPVSARSAYQNWLLEQVCEGQLDKFVVNAGESRRSPHAYTRLSFTVGGRGTLEELTELLFHFYSACHLHKIVSLTITPVEQTKELSLSISIEALSLPGADQRDRLADKPAQRLAFSELDAYLSTIAQRKIFSPYQPTPEKADPSEQSGPDWDKIKQLVVTAIVEADGKPQVWIELRPTDQRFELGEEDSFEVGSLTGSVIRIGQREVELEVGGNRYRVALGKSVKEATKPASPESPNETD